MKGLEFANLSIERASQALREFPPAPRDRLWFTAMASPAQPMRISS